MAHKPKQLRQPQLRTLQADMADLLKKHQWGAITGTDDDVLAEYVIGCLAAFQRLVVQARPPLEIDNTATGAPGR